jgi:vancomycin permeability regulator SanA
MFGRLFRLVWGHRVGRGVVCLVVGMGCWFVCHTCAILLDGFSDEPHAADVAVILGNKVHRDGRLSRKLKSRLDRGLSLYREGPVKTLIASGALGKEGYQEAFVMAEYLRKQGVPSHAVIEDPQGVNTFYTAKNTLQLMKKRGFSSVVVVSNAYHISRCKLAFRRFGLQHVYGAHASYPDWFAWWSIGREFVAFYVYLVRSYQVA